MRTSLTADSYGSRLHLDIDSTPSVAEHMVKSPLWRQFIPGIELESNVLREQNSNISIRIESDLSWEYKHVDRYLQLSPEYTDHAIVTVGYLLDAKRQEDGLYTLHGNIITNGPDTIALFGPISGIGKTSLSAFAADNGWRWIADEKFVIDKSGNYIGSTPGVLNDTKTKKSAGESQPDANSEFNRKIGAFMLPIIAEGTTLAAHRYTNDKAFWHLNEEMSHDVRMTPFTLNGPDTPLPSFDTDEISEQRRRAATAISDKVPVIFTMGSREAILEYASQRTA